MPFPYTFPFYFETAEYFKRPYHLELHEANVTEDCVCYLTEVFGVSIRAELNAPAELKFSARLDNPNNALITHGREVWVLNEWDLHDAQGHRTISVGKFRLIKRSDSHGPDGVVATFECRDPLLQLIDESVFDQLFENQTIAAILATVFAGQTSPRPLALGTIAASIAAEIQTVTVNESMTALALIAAIEENLPFSTQYWVDEKRRFNWRRIDTLEPGAVIDDTKRFAADLRIGQNMRVLRRETDYSGIVTRLYAYGQNIRGERIKLSEALGQTEDYVENFAWTSAVRSRMIVNKNIADADQLLVWATLKLVELAAPQISYQIDVTDMAAVRDDVAPLAVGQMRHIEDDAIGVETNLNVLAMTANLDNKAEVEVELGILRRERSIEGIIGDLVDDEVHDDHTDSLNDDQVYITDETTLDDWEYDDTGEIDGGKVRPYTVWEHRFGAVKELTKVETPYEYTVTVLTNPTKAPTVPPAEWLRCIQVDDSLGILVVGTEVYLSIPPEAQRSAGALPIIVLGAPGGIINADNRVVWNEGE